jgi:hypothetical protein
MLYQAAIIIFEEARAQLESEQTNRNLSLAILAILTCVYSLFKYDRNDGSARGLPEMLPMKHCIPFWSLIAESSRAYCILCSEL